MFPAPLEVDRYLYYRNLAQFGSALAFPAPREVNRFLYLNLQLSRLMMRGKSFPAPREVDRYLYTLWYKLRKKF